MAWRPRRFRFRFRRRRVNRTDSLSEATRKGFNGTLYIMLGSVIYGIVAFAMNNINSVVQVAGITIDLMLFFLPIASIINLLFLFKGVRLIGVRI